MTKNIGVSPFLKEYNRLIYDSTIQKTIENLEEIIDWLTGDFFQECLENQDKIPKGWTPVKYGERKYWVNGSVNFSTQQFTRGVLYFERSKTDCGDDFYFVNYNDRPFLKILYLCTKNSEKKNFEYHSGDWETILTEFYMNSKSAVKIKPF